MRSLISSTAATARRSYHSLFGHLNCVSCKRGLQHFNNNSLVCNNLVTCVWLSDGLSHAPVTVVTGFSICYRNWFMRNITPCVTERLDVCVASENGFCAVFVWVEQRVNFTASFLVTAMWMIMMTTIIVIITCWYNNNNNNNNNRPYYNCLLSPRQNSCQGPWGISLFTTTHKFTTHLMIYGASSTVV